MSNKCLSTKAVCVWAWGPLVEDGRGFCSSFSQRGFAQVCISDVWRYTKTGEALWCHAQGEWPCRHNYRPAIRHLSLICWPFTSFFLSILGSSTYNTGKLKQFLLYSVPFVNLVWNLNSSWPAGVLYRLLHVLLRMQSALHLKNHNIWFRHLHNWRPLCLYPCFFNLTLVNIQV